MNGLWPQLRMNLQLYFRNTMALVYGYAFPAIFLVAFWVLYRYERVPLVRHMGELLTIAVLGGACFGLPTTIVSERERGVWRRYRLTPVPTLNVVGSTLVARYAILVSAGVLQVALAMAFGMPLPRHPIELFVAFSCVAFAFMGLGLVIAMLADNVPAVQALGQCIFLPMLIIGGIAVQLSALPDWALHVSAFFPGRYAVEAIQATVTGNGLGGARFALAALVVIGTAGSLAGARMFRWDAQQRFMATPGKGWLAVAFAGWAAVGAMAELQGRIGVAPVMRAENTATAPAPEPGPALTSGALAPPAPVTVPSTPALVPDVTPPSSAAPAPRGGMPPATAPPGATSIPLQSSPSNAGGGRTAQPAAPESAEPLPGSQFKSWQEVTRTFVEKEFVFTSKEGARLPPDSGVVTPVAPLTEDPGPEITAEIETVQARLPEWAPGRVADPVQRVRNLLFVAAVPDVFQMQIESYLPHVVFAEIQRTVPEDDLVKILAWIALRPDEGSDAAVDQLAAVGLSNGPSDMGETRYRAATYAVKLLGHVLGKRPFRQ